MEESWRKFGMQKNQSYANSFTTFFFSNFPASHGEYEMLTFFQKWARVKEVFISRRRNRWGRRFDFVRFFGTENVVSLERELDSTSTKSFINDSKQRRLRNNHHYKKHGGNFVNKKNLPRRLPSLKSC